MLSVLTMIKIKKGEKQTQTSKVIQLAVFRKILLSVCSKYFLQMG